MRWEQSRQSDNVEDRRGSTVRRSAAVGGGGLLLVIIAALFGVDPSALLGLRNAIGATKESGGGVVAETAQEKEQVQFVRSVLGDTEDTWHKLFREAGKEYREPVLVLFREAVESACGFQQTATGPFYCPGDEKVYIDLNFYATLRERLGAPGDFAQAYVIAHEVGHHVQNLLGISERVHRQRAGADEATSNALSVRMELQADFFAGVWAHWAQSRNLLEAGDVEEALNAAAAIGDDRLQKQARGYVQPESFTHGTSEQRVRWFRKGLTTGDLTQGDTFGAEKL